MRISDWSSDVCSSDLAAPDLSIVEPAVELQPLGELLADRQRRVERGHRFLEHHADAGTADRAQVAFFQRGQFLSLEADRARRAVDAGGKPAGDGPGCHRLAAARFPDAPAPLAALAPEIATLEQRRQTRLAGHHVPNRAPKQNSR